MITIRLEGERPEEVDAAMAGGEGVGEEEVEILVGVGDATGESVVELSTRLWACRIS